MVRLVKDERSAAAVHDDRPNRSPGVGKERYRIIHRSCQDGAFSAAHPEHVHGCLDHHLFGVVGRDVAAGEREDAFHHGEEGLAFPRILVVIELIQDDAGLGVHGKHRTIVENQRYVRILPGLHHVSFEDRRVNSQIYRCAVGPGDGDLSYQGRNLADGWGVLDGSRLGVLSWCTRSRQPSDQIPWKNATFRRHQGWGGRRSEISGDQDVGTVRCTDEQILAFA